METQNLSTTICAAQRHTSRASSSAATGTVSPSSTCHQFEPSDDAAKCVASSGCSMSSSMVTGDERSTTSSWSSSS